MIGLFRIGNISFWIVLVIGNNLVPKPAEVNTAIKPAEAIETQPEDKENQAT